MLLNMVKIRYADAPVFLDVNSIISQYALDSAITLNSSWSSPKEGFGGGNNLGIGGIGRYFDRPTITYSPMSGEKFAQRLMTPIPPPSLLSMIQTGFPIDLVFRLCIHSMNGVQNRFGGGARARPPDPEFYPLLERMRRVQSTGVMGMRPDRGEPDGHDAIYPVHRELLYDGERAGNEGRIVYGGIYIPFCFFSRGCAELAAQDAAGEALVYLMMNSDEERRIDYHG